MLTNADITLYNRYESEEGMKWSRWVIKGVFWHGCTGVGVQNSGLASANIIKIRIPHDARVEGAVYAPSAQCLFDWQWTLQTGDKLALGVLTDTTPPQDAFTIMQWADNTMGRKGSSHFRISAG